MAWRETRTTRSGETVYRVSWRQDGKKQTESFQVEEKADEFQVAVEKRGNLWPRGWKPGVGYASDSPHLTSVMDWCEQHMVTNTRASDRTIADYRRMLELHVYPVLGPVAITEVENTDVAEWIRYLQDKHLSRKSIENIHSMLSGLMSSAVIQGVVKFNPITGTLPQSWGVDEHEMVILLPEELQQIIACIPNWLHKTVAAFLYGTGLRWSEMTALRVADVTLDGARPALRVNKAWKRQADGSYRLGQTKTLNGRRTLALSDDLVALLRPLVIGRDPGELLFTQDGEPMAHHTFYNNAWKKGVAKASVCDDHLEAQRYKNGRLPELPKPCGCSSVLKKKPRIHDLRHSHASWLISHGVAPIAIQRRLGHASITTTFDVYGHLLPDMDVAINTAVDRAVENLIIVEEIDEGDEGEPQM